MITSTEQDIENRRFALEQAVKFFDAWNALGTRSSDVVKTAQKFYDFLNHPSHEPRT